MALYLRSQYWIVALALVFFVCTISLHSERARSSDYADAEQEPDDVDFVQVGISASRMGGNRTVHGVAFEKVPDAISSNVSEPVPADAAHGLQLKPNTDTTPSKRPQKPPSTMKGRVDLTETALVSFGHQARARLRGVAAAIVQAKTKVRSGPGFVEIAVSQLNAATIGVIFAAFFLPLVAIGIYATYIALRPKESDGFSNQKDVERASLVGRSGSGRFETADAPRWLSPMSGGSRQVLRKAQEEVKVAEGGVDHVTYKRRAEDLPATKKSDNGTTRKSGTGATCKSEVGSAQKADTVVQSTGAISAGSTKSPHEGVLAPELARQFNRFQQPVDTGFGLCDELMVQMPGGITLGIRGTIDNYPQEEELHVCKCDQRGDFGQVLATLRVSETGACGGIFMESSWGFPVSYLDTSSAVGTNRAATYQDRKVSIYKSSGESLEASEKTLFAVVQMTAGAQFVVKKCLPDGRAGDVILIFLGDEVGRTANIVDSNGRLVAGLEMPSPWKTQFATMYVNLAHGADAGLVISAVVACKKLA